MNTVPANEKCMRCDEDYYIGDLLICNNCKKILCNDCKSYLTAAGEVFLNIAGTAHHCQTNNQKVIYGKLEKIYNK